MSTYLTDEVIKVRRILQDNASNDDDNILQHIDVKTLISEQALYKFSKDFPQSLKKLYYGEDEYNYALPSDWQDEFSVGIEIITDIDSQIPTVKDTSDWTIYTPDVSEYDISDATAASTSVTLSTVKEALFFKDGDLLTIADSTNSETLRVTADGSGTTGVVTTDALENSYTSPTIKKQGVIRFLNETPDSNDVFEFNYTTTHTLTESSITIPTAQRTAFRELSTSVCAMAIANHYRFSHDSSIDADSVDNLAKAEQWDSVAALHYKAYKGYVGESESDRVDAASATGEWDLNFSWGNEHVFHPRKWH